VQSPAPPGKDSPRVLHIDYPPPILRLLEQKFRGRPIVLESAESGVLGLHLALVRNYHLIFLGLKEVGVDGVRVARGLMRAGINTPVVLFMARRDLEHRREELSRLTNVIACLSKPLEMAQVEKAMEFLKHPPALNAKDRVKLLETLARIEKAVQEEAA
jgi:DNA-binding response OmpR family regulator